MKSKFQLFASVVQLIVGILAIASFIILSSGGENTTKWVITLILSILYVIMGITGIFNYRAKK